VLFSEPKIPQFGAREVQMTRDFPVSVLFSEPKIPQSVICNVSTAALNVSVLFSEPKIPQSVIQIVADILTTHVSVLFSEPKIPQSCDDLPRQRRQRVFQCSSASRKFLNYHTDARLSRVSLSFSALQRAENSSILTNS